MPKIHRLPPVYVQYAIDGTKDTSGQLHLLVAQQLLLTSQFAA